MMLRSMEDRGTPELTIVIPVFNEAAILVQVLRPFLIWLQDAGLVCEILLCENGSTDHTLDEARRLQAEYPQVRALHLDEPNYGKALRHGVERARGDYIALLDVDRLDQGFLQTALRAIEGADVVIGSRTMRGAADRRPAIRRGITWIFNRILWLPFGTRLTDTHGNMLLRRATVQPLVRSCRTDRWLFDTELLLRCERMGLRVLELPLAIDEVRKTRYTLWRQVPTTLADLAKLFWYLRLRDRHACRSQPTS